MEVLWYVVKSAIYDAVLYAVFSSSLLIPPSSAPIASSCCISKHTPFIHPLWRNKFHTHINKMQDCSSTSFNSYIIKRVNGKVRRSKQHWSRKYTSLTHFFYFFALVDLICYFRSKVFENCHIFKGLINYLHAIIFFCIMLLRNDFVVIFLNIYFWTSDKFFTKIQ